MPFLTNESFTTGFPEKYGNVNSTECFSGALDAASFANVRLDQLFFEWLLLPETAELLECFNDNIQLSCNALEEVLQNVSRTTTSDGPVLNAQGAKAQQEQLLSWPLGNSLSSRAACKAKQSSTRKQPDDCSSRDAHQTSFPHEALENSSFAPNASCKNHLKKQERPHFLTKKKVFSELLAVNNGTSPKHSQDTSGQDGSLTDDFSPGPRSQASTQSHTSDQRCFALLRSRTTSSDPSYGATANGVEMSPLHPKSDQRAEVSAVLTETTSSPAKNTARDRSAQFTTKTDYCLLEHIEQQGMIATHQTADGSTALPMELLEENEGIHVYSYGDKENVPVFCEKPASSPFESNNETPKLKNEKVNSIDLPSQESLAAGFSFPTCNVKLKTDVTLDPYLLDHIEKLYASVTPGLPGLPYTHFEAFLTSLGMSKYLAPPLFADLDTEGTGYVPKDQFIQFGTGRFFPKDLTLTFFHLLQHKDNPFITAQDLQRFVQVVVDRHPGLEFMKPTPEFQQRYAVTVVTRLLYMLDLHGTKKVYLFDLRRFDMSRVEEYEQHYAALQGAPPAEGGTPDMLLPIDMINAFLPLHLPGIWASLDEMDTVNYERFFFSFEHFYVINAIFSDLDQNHDFALDQQDLLRYDHHALSMRTVTRIASILGSSKQQEDETVAAGSSFSLSYEDFIVMILNEEDKTTSRSLEFWFRVVDLDEDGYIRPYEMQFFYEEQAQRLEALNQESIPFQHVLCQMNDLMNPRVPGEFTLTDFIRNKKTSGAFFDMLLSLTKTLTRELRDPYQTKQEMDENPFLSPWDRFALREYHLLLLTDGQEDIEQTTASEPEQPPSGCAPE